MNVTSILKKRVLGASIGAVALCLALGACGGAPASTGTAADGFSDASAAEAVSGTVTTVGSTALQPLAEAAAEAYMAENAGVQISIQGGGSGQGITQVAEGAVQIGDSDVFAEEKLDDPAKAAELTDNKVCVVGMGPVAHPEVGVTDLTMDQLRGIFSGTITNWKDVGGADLPIVVINRASGSGTRATFEAAVFEGSEPPSDFTAQEQDSSGTVAKMVKETPGAISYLAFSYYDDDLLGLAVDGVQPTEDNVATNDWKIWAYEHMYTKAEPDAATRSFIDFMLGDEVQGSLVEEMGYIPIGSMKVQKAADGTVSEISS